MPGKEDAEYLSRLATERNKYIDASEDTPAGHEWTKGYIETILPDIVKHQVEQEKIRRGSEGSEYEEQIRRLVKQGHDPD